MGNRFRSKETITLKVGQNTMRRLRQCAVECGLDLDDYVSELLEVAMAERRQVERELAKFLHEFSNSGEPVSSLAVVGR